MFAINDSKIINSEELKSKVKSLLPPTAKFMNLYRASRDGKSAIDFHSRCDNKGPTITIVKSENGTIFGGYTDISWFSSKSCDDHEYQHTSFIFSIRTNGEIVKLQS